MQRADINNAACALAREVANEGGALVAGSLSSVPPYAKRNEKEFVQEAFHKQCDVFVDKDVDFVLAEVGISSIWKYAVKGACVWFLNMEIFIQKMRHHAINYGNMNINGKINVRLLFALKLEHFERAPSWLHDGTM